MPEATLTSKGQITLPIEIREALSLHAGDKISFVMEASGKVRLEPAKFSIKTLKGVVRSSGKAVSLDEMDKAIRRRAGKF